MDNLRIESKVYVSLQIYVNFIVQFTSVCTNILSCRWGRVEEEIPAYKTEYLYVPSICTINDLYHDQ